MWGWTLSKAACFQLLNAFYNAGFRQVDAATNYPINKNPEDFRAAEKILLEWINTHGVNDLEVIMKVGSLNNLRSPDHNLKKSFLLLILDDYRQRFGSNLDTLMIHWDNRDNQEEIRDTFEALQICTEQGVQIGLSGIRHPEIYADLNTHFELDFRIEVKHHLWQSDIDRYPQFQDQPRFLAYGINAGGIKLNTKQYEEDSNLIIRGGVPEKTPLHERLERAIPLWNRQDLPVPISQFNQIGLIYAYHHPQICGILIGPSRLEQLTDSIRFFHHLQGDLYMPVFVQLTQL